MEQKDIFIEGNLTADDVYNYQKAVLFKRFSPLSLVIVIGFVLMVSIMNLVRGLQSNNLPIGTAVFVLIAVTFIVMFPKQLRKSSKVALETNKLLQKTQCYRIGNEGVEVSSETGKSFIRWNEFYKAIETKYGFALFLSKNQAYIIPKRFLSEESEKIELLRSYLKNAPTPKEEKKVFGIFKRGLNIGCLMYVLLFITILVILALYSSK